MTAIGRAERADTPDAGDPDDITALRRAVHRHIALVSEDFDRRKYNTAIARLMEIIFSRDITVARRGFF